MSSPAEHVGRAPKPAPAATEPPADVCLIIEGAYPYIRGGVSSWTQDLIATQQHLRFHVLVIVAPDAELELRYKLPPNVCALSHVVAGALPLGAKRLPRGALPIETILETAGAILSRGDPDDLNRLVEQVASSGASLGSRLLLDSRAAWAAFNDVYRRSCHGASYLNAFWGWRTLISGLFSMLLCELPPARVYHCVSTGYAGLLAARAHYETGLPAMVTEHGVYANERRLEIMSAPWLAVDDTRSLALGAGSNRVKEMWIRAFVGYSKACYGACSEIITLFEENFALQVEDGAIRERLGVIANGVDPARYAGVVHSPNRVAGGNRPPTVALIGRVVPIKDIKTYLRAAALLKAKIPDVVCLILGPMDEDPDYAHDCFELARQLHLGETIQFKGMVDLMSYVGDIDIQVLTSISEGQPLVILECGAAAVPAVATDVGACRELIYGRSNEAPAIGPGGRVVPIGTPSAIADAIAELLLDEELRQACGEAMRRRVLTHYDKAQLHIQYAERYTALLAQADAVAAERG